MSAMLTLRKHFKMTDAEVESGFNPPAIPFIPKSSTLKLRTIKSSTFASPPPTRIQRINSKLTPLQMIPQCCVRFGEEDTENY